MSTRFLMIGLVGLSLAGGCSQPAGDPTEAASVAAIERLGGKVERDASDPTHPVIKVYLHQTQVKDADLVVLQKLPRLQNLFLGKTGITDAGLESLKSLTRLKTLSLNGTPITDAGLIHLTGLTELKTLNLQDTQVTRAGILTLQQSLKTTTIAR